MEILWSLGLLVVIVLALNSMAGGHASAVIRPACRVAENLLSIAVKSILKVFGSVLKIGSGSHWHLSRWLTEDVFRKGMCCDERRGQFETRSATIVIEFGIAHKKALKRC